PAVPEIGAEGAAAQVGEPLHEANRQLAHGDPEGATKGAKDIEANATRLKELYLDSTKSLDATEAQITYLRGEGVLTNGVEADLKSAREMLDKGSIEASIAVAIRIQGELEVIGNSYRKATTGIA